MPKYLSRPGATPSYVRSRQQFGDSKLSAQYLSEKLANVKQWQCTDLKGHFGCVNALEFSDDGRRIVSGGDDRRVLLWNVEKALARTGTPSAMQGEHNSNIFCLAFMKGNGQILSGGNDAQVILHDVQSGQALDTFQHEEAVYCLSAHPDDDRVFASAGDDGRALVYDLRLSASDPFELTQPGDPMHGIMFNPVDPQYIATINANEGPSLWDIRQNRQPVEKYMYSVRPGGNYSGMSVRFNSSGDRLVAIGRKMPPVVYDVSKRRPLHCFDADGYYNACTIKSCCFAGDKDQYIVSGSDDFRVYIWRVPDHASFENKWISTPFSILAGHRSIVNQVRFNGTGRCLFISSGVEKVIKAWSPLGLQSSLGKGCCRDCDHVEHEERRVYTHEEYIDLVLRSGHFMAHDYSEQSVNEDPRMIAFFDSLVQRELEDDSTSSSSSGDANILHEMPSSPSTSSWSSDSSSSPAYSLEHFTARQQRGRTRRSSSSSTEVSSPHNPHDDNDDNSAPGQNNATGDSVTRPSGRYSPFTCAFFTRVIAPASSSTASTGSGARSAGSRTMSDLIALKRASYVKSLADQTNGCAAPQPGCSGSSGAGVPTAVGTVATNGRPQLTEREASRLDRRRSRIVHKLRRIRARLIMGASSSSTSGHSSGDAADGDVSDGSGTGGSEVDDHQAGPSDHRAGSLVHRSPDLQMGGQALHDLPAELGQRSGGSSTSAADRLPAARHLRGSDDDDLDGHPNPLLVGTTHESKGSDHGGGSVDGGHVVSSAAAGSGRWHEANVEHEEPGNVDVDVNGVIGQAEALPTEANGENRTSEGDRPASYFKKRGSVCNRRQYRGREGALD